MAEGPDRYALSSRVHQATGMVAVQLDCTIDEALNRLIIRAAASGRSLERVALDVLDRVLRFDP
ncbi:MAG: hypothetical protein QOE62_2188 [Actinomycetota bacterium]|jgi:hypothetical protein|nr:hypothetical protein [Actinomycetota bacterium]